MIELWGTFSVRDHLVDRAFVADVLLYDRLVIPTLPEDAPETDWPPEWNLKKQKALLGDLGELAIPIPWDKDRRDAWQKRFDDTRVEERRLSRASATTTIKCDATAARNWNSDEQAFWCTRQLLRDCANEVEDNKLFRKLRVTNRARPGSDLEAVSAYPSYDAFAHDVPQAGSAKPTGDKQSLNPTTVFGWKFFVPDSAERGEDEDRKLLEKTLKLARTTEFAEMRGNFYLWWSDVVESGLSAAEAKADMEKRIAEYQKLINGQKWKTAARYAIRVADAFSGGLGLVNEVAAAGAEAFLGSADILAEERLKGENAPARLKVAAIFHDARARLGWK
jgi:hypothetical protein